MKQYKKIFDVCENNSMDYYIEFEEINNNNSRINKNFFKRIKDLFIKIFK